MLELFPATPHIYNCFGCPSACPLTKTLYRKLSTTSIKYKVLSRTVEHIGAFSLELNIQDPDSSDLLSLGKILRTTSVVMTGLLGNHNPNHKRTV